MIDTMSVLSTAHLCEQTCQVWLPTAPFAVYVKDPFGWFVYVCDDEPDDLPSDIKACLAMARAQACAWVMFDCDADVAPALPVYDW